VTHDTLDHDHIAVLIAYSTFERIAPGNIVTTTLGDSLACPMTVLAVDVQPNDTYARLQIVTMLGIVLVAHLHRAFDDVVTDADGFVMRVVLE